VRTVCVATEDRNFSVPDRRKQLTLPYAGNPLPSAPASCLMRAGRPRSQ
jgi:hypothetical protein